MAPPLGRFRRVRRRGRHRIDRGRNRRSTLRSYRPHRFQTIRDQFQRFEESSRGRAPAVYRSRPTMAADARHGSMYVISFIPSSYLLVLIFFAAGVWLPCYQWKDFRVVTPLVLPGKLNEPLTIATFKSEAVPHLRQELVKELVEHVDPQLQSISAQTSALQDQMQIILAMLSQAPLFKHISAPLSMRSLTTSIPPSTVFPLPPRIQAPPSPVTTTRSESLLGLHLSTPSSPHSASSIPRSQVGQTPSEKRPHRSPPPPLHAPHFAQADDPTLFKQLFDYLPTNEVASQLHTDMFTSPSTAVQLSSGRTTTRQTDSAHRLSPSPNLTTSTPTSPTPASQLPASPPNFIEILSDSDKENPNKNRPPSTAPRNLTIPRFTQLPTDPVELASPAGKFNLCPSQ